MAALAMLTALVLLPGCSQSPEMDTRTLNRLTEAGRAIGPGQTLALDTVTDFAWDRLLIAGPYTTPADIEKAAGAALPDAARKSGIEARDDIVLLLFIDGPRVARAVTLARSVMDFGKADQMRLISKAQARFVRAATGPLLTQAAGAS